MTHFLNVKEPQNLHELSWAYAQDGKVATDIATGLLVDANPAMEALVGYSRAELIGMHVTMLHPEPERKLVEAEFRKAMLHPAPHFDLHIQRKDGRSVPVAIWSSEKLKLQIKCRGSISFRPRIGRWVPMRLRLWRWAGLILPKACC
jgi:PAS domain S-box-containing protein